ncbi:MAG: Beta-lactamase OXA-18 [Chlamydiales bacterium]|nr:Beta-lactamase OXA-18 [Chlamydiales bacterium]MCH9620002.1 Beta-lactamase OXA-18 [Chlamydiales bacterium]MCH9622894.1 Beta-lactamase OXA-18 [Chlamydiales bacterium]
MDKCILAITLLFSSLCAEENFLLIESSSKAPLFEMGSRLDDRITPTSTFKIALSLIGFDTGILENEQAPIWHFQEGYDDFLAVWRLPQNPYSWIKTSCVWFSNLLVMQLGEESFQTYLAHLDYGNQDISDGLSSVWITSSLKISPKEQVEFIRKMVCKELPISDDAIKTTKKLLYVDNLGEGWQLYGKTGWSGSTIKADGENQVGWFVGWVETKNSTYPFSYSILNPNIDCAKRVSRAKELIEKALNPDAR